MASILNDSILLSVKKMLGIPAEHTQFDPDIIMDINSTFTILNQLGVGPEGGFSISDDTTTWSEYTIDQMLNSVKTYMFVKVQMMFDPPTSGIVLQAKKDIIAELEWRLNVQVDPGEDEDES